MKRPILISLTTVALVVVGTPAFMNSACRRSHHSWCGPHYGVMHHTKAERSWLC
jgi:hypothetical protein